MRKISTLVVSVLCMMMPVGAEAQVPTAFVSKGATDIQAQPHSITQTNSGAQLAAIDPLMNGVGAPWVLYGIGAVIAIVPTIPIFLPEPIPSWLRQPIMMGYGRRMRQNCR